MYKYVFLHNNVAANFTSSLHVTAHRLPFQVLALVIVVVLAFCSFFVQKGNKGTALNVCVAIATDVFRPG